MSSAEIIAELVKLNAEERRQVYERLCQMQEEDLLRGAGPTDEEKRILDQALAEYEKDGDKGRPWRQVLGELRSGKIR